MNAKLENCPAPEKLANFLLGRLPTGENESCEEHLASCHPCVDTIRGLNVDSDTLNDLTRQAWTAAAEHEPESGTESQVVDGIIQRMQSLTHVQRVGELGGRSQVDEDRAAEVQRLLGPPLQPDEIGSIGDYRIVSMLGAGSTGVVYKAIDSQLDRTVALKVLRPSLGQAARKRFVAEARAAAAVAHPNVVPIYRAGSHGDLAFMAMQWIPGQTLDQLLDQQETLSIEQVQKLGTQIASGLAAAHEQGLIHRDIKPANIWIAEDNQDATILDFGLVRITDENPQLTCTGMIAGTPCFMSPEQSRGQKLDCRSDLFSLGCVLYQSLAGRLPFRSGNALATLQSIQREQPTSLVEVDPAIPTDVSDLVMMLLEKSPSRRPPTANDVVAAINSPREDWPFEVPTTAPTKQTQTMRGRIGFGWKSIASAIAILFFAALGILFQPQITRIITNRGEIVIESEVDDIQIEVLRNGEFIRLIDLSTEQVIEIKAGEYEFRPTSDENGIEIKNGVLTLSRGEKEIVKITRNAANNAGNISEAPEFMPVTPKVVEGKWIEVKPDVRLIELAPGTIKRLRFPQAIPEIAVATQGIFRVQPVSSNEVVLTAIKTGSTYVNFAFADDSIQRIEISVKAGVYQLAAGDVLGVFIGGVLGEVDENPPINYPDPSSGMIPSVGFPIPVNHDGTISLPLVKPLDVNGITVRDAELVIKEAYMGGDTPILNKNGRILVSIMRRRDYQPPAPTANSSQGLYDELNMELYRLEMEKAAASKKYGASHTKMRDLDQRIELTKRKLAEFLSISPSAARSNPSQQSSEEQTSRLLQSGFFKLRASAERLLGLGRGDDAVDMLEQFKESMAAADISNNLRKALGQVIDRDIDSMKEHIRSMENPIRNPPVETDIRRNPNVSDGGGGTGLGDSGQKKRLPVFDGRSYSEWLKIAKRERDMSILNPAIKALAVLADKEQKPEMIATIMEVARRGTGLADVDEVSEFNRFMKRFIGELEPMEAKDLFVNEWANGTRFSKGFVSSDFPSIAHSFTSLDEAKRHAAVSDVLDAVIDNFDPDSGEAAWQELGIITALKRQIEYPMADNEKLGEFLQELFSVHRTWPLNNHKQLIFFELIPEQDGIVENVVNDLHGTSNVVANWRVSVGFQAFKILPMRKRKQIVTQLVDKFEDLEAAEKPSYSEKLGVFVDHWFQETEPSLAGLKSIVESNNKMPWAEELRQKIEAAERLNDKIERQN